MEVELHSYALETAIAAVQQRMLQLEVEIRRVEERGLDSSSLEDEYQGLDSAATALKRSHDDALRRAQERGVTLNMASYEELMDVPRPVLAVYVSDYELRHHAAQLQKPVNLGSVEALSETLLTGLLDSKGIDFADIQGKLRAAFLDAAKQAIQAEYDKDNLPVDKVKSKRPI